jgi:superfamily II DNA or RNA helicase
MKTDFCSYESNRLICDQCYELLSGVSKQTSRRVMIATWAMLYRQEASFFTQFDVFICDEAHQADSMALSKIINMMPHVRYRFGFTGTLDGSKTHELQCRAWFGSMIKSSSTKDLMDKGLLSSLEICSLSIEYSEKDKQEMKSSDYKTEIDFIVSHPQRNEFLVDLALSQSSNTLLLFNLIEKHGEVIFKIAEQKAKEKGKKVFFISGDTGVDRREYIRQTMERENNVVLFASFGTLSVGVNIKNLGCLIFAHPYKARIRTLQSIGRTLRILEGKMKAKLIDILDNLCYKHHTNFAMKHAIERLKIYESEGFNISYETINFE